MLSYEYLSLNEKQQLAKKQLLTVLNNKEVLDLLNSKFNNNEEFSLKEIVLNDDSFSETKKKDIIYQLKQGFIYPDSVIVRYLNGVIFVKTECDLEFVRKEQISLNKQDYFLFELDLDSKVFVDDIPF